MPGRSRSKMTYQPVPSRSAGVVVGGREVEREEGDGSDYDVSGVECDVFENHQFNKPFEIGRFALDRR